MEPRHEAALQRIWEADRNLTASGGGPENFEVLPLGDDGIEIEHGGWDSSWANPAEATLEDLAEIGLLRIDTNLAGTPFSLTMKGREEVAKLLTPVPEVAGQPMPSAEQLHDPRKVALMHGRDLEATRWMRAWLRSIDLDPLEWSDLVKLTGKGSPYNGEAVEAAFRDAQAVVVLFTPDEVGLLHPDFGLGDGGAQPRLNVVLEAGMALQSHPDRTILVEMGSTRMISDLAGRNAVRLTGGHEGVNELASRLATAGCPVNRTGADWLDMSGMKDLAALSRREIRPISSGGVVATALAGGSHCLFRIRGESFELRLYDQSGWGTWSKVGASPGEVIDLAASSIGPGHVEVFALMASGEILRNWWRKGDGWQAEFSSLGQPFPDHQAVRITGASKSEGHEEVFVETADGQIAHIWWEGRWHRNNDRSTRLNSGWWRF